MYWVHASLVVPRAAARRSQVVQSTNSKQLGRAKRGDVEWSKRLGR
jgi:hypothetical protein